MKCRGTSRHFLIWLHKQGIVLKDINQNVIIRFIEHRCRCHGYTQPALRHRTYKGRVSLFVRYLEESGIIPVPACELEIEPLLKEYEAQFRTAGYSNIVRTLHLYEAEHFSCWLHQERISWSDIDDVVIDRFKNHQCFCPLLRKRMQLAASGTSRRDRATRVFLTFLRDNGHLPEIEPIMLTEEQILVAAYRKWLVDCVGAKETTINSNILEINRWIDLLGCDPSKYTPLLIRNIVLTQDPDRAPATVKNTACVLRSFLRFLTFRGNVSPHLLRAVPSTPPPRHGTALPRYAPPEKISEIIEACQTKTPIQIRDRAIILLLARLGLRAGDITSLCFDAIDWKAGTLLVTGKSRRPTRLPLPQDVGDAILAYIKRARPPSAEGRIFLTANAPFHPLRSSAGIGNVVERVLQRGQIENVPPGSHMFRHSLATNMLRSGSTLDAIGTVLRHSSPSVTSNYARVDLPMLMSVTQSWPGESKC